MVRPHHGWISIFMSLSFCLFSDLSISALPFSSVANLLQSDSNNTPARAMKKSGHPLLIELVDSMTSSSSAS